MALIRLEDYEGAAIWGVHATSEPRAYHMTHVLAALALKLNGQSVAAEKQIGEAFKLLPGFSLQNFRNILPQDDETSPSRVLTINTLKKLGVPEAVSVKNVVTHCLIITLLFSKALPHHYLGLTSLHQLDHNS